jgi:antitoxin YefM
METTTFSDFRKNMKEKLDKVYDDRDILLIKRSENKDVVVLSLEDYNSMTETAYLLSTKANARQLLEAVKDVEEGKKLLKKRINL